MNIFRLVLCLVGVATYLILRPLAQDRALDPAQLPPRDADRQLTQSTHATANPGRPPSPAALPVIAHPPMRERIVTVMAGSGGPLYNVTTHDGETLAPALTKEELRRSYPELYELLKAGARVMPTRAGRHPTKPGLD